jgi:hypothetical protein
MTARNLAISGFSQSPSAENAGTGTGGTMGAVGVEKQIGVFLSLSQLPKRRCGSGVAYRLLARRKCASAAASDRARRRRTRRWMADISLEAV